MVKRALLSSLSDIDIRLLRIFVTVTECGGFAASELELNIGRSTISKHIADLETRIGLILCNRGPAGFSLTEEGDQVLEATRRLLAHIDEFQSEIDNVHTTFKSTYTNEVSLKEALSVEAVQTYARMATGEKYLINPSKGA